MKVTKLDSCRSPKFVPPTVTAAPTDPEVEESDEIVGIAESTMREAVALIPLDLAVMLAFPAPRVETKPGVVLLIVTTIGLEEVQLAEAVRSFELPSE